MPKISSSESQAPTPKVQIPTETKFEPEAVSKLFQEALSGHYGTDKKENIIISLVTTHKSLQRQAIRAAYKTRFNKDLAKELKKQFKGHFADVMFRLMLHPQEFLAHQVHFSIKGSRAVLLSMKAFHVYGRNRPVGLGTNERKLIDLLCYRTDVELFEMKLYYKENYGKEMEEAVADDLSGEFKDLLMAMMNATRIEWSGIDDELVHADAQSLFEVRQADLGAREELFKLIFNSRGPVHMRQVFIVYGRYTSGKIEIEDTVKSAFSGSVKKAYLAMIKSCRNLVGYNAERLHSAMVRPGTDDDTLMEVLISRSEIDLKEISNFYEARYKTKLRDAVTSDTSGCYRTALISLLDNFTG